MKRLSFIPFFLFAIGSALAAYTAHDSYQPGDVYVVDYNAVLADGTLQKEDVFFPTLTDLEGWLLENHDSETVRNIWAAKLKRSLEWRTEISGGEVDTGEEPMATPYRVTYEVRDSTGTWQFQCSYATLEDAQALVDSIEADDHRRLYPSDPPKLIDVHVTYVVSDGVPRVVIYDPGG